MKTNTCVSLNCPFMNLCKHYNFLIDRGEKCIIQEEIVQKAIKLEKEKGKIMNGNMQENTNIEYQKIMDDDIGKTITDSWGNQYVISTKECLIKQLLGLKEMETLGWAEIDEDGEVCISFLATKMIWEDSIIILLGGYGAETLCCNVEDANEKTEQNIRDMVDALFNLRAIKDKYIYIATEKGMAAAREVENTPYLSGDYSLITREQLIQALLQMNQMKFDLAEMDEKTGEVRVSYTAEKMEWEDTTLILLGGHGAEVVCSYEFGCEDEVERNVRNMVDDFYNRIRHIKDGNIYIAPMSGKREDDNYMIVNADMLIAEMEEGKKYLLDVNWNSFCDYELMFIKDGKYYFFPMNKEGDSFVPVEDNQHYDTWDAEMFHNHFNENIAEFRDETCVEDLELKTVLDLYICGISPAAFSCKSYELIKYQTDIAGQP